METTLTFLDEVALVRVSGTIDSRSAGPLYDDLVSAMAAGASKLVVDLSGICEIKRAGVRGLVVAGYSLSRRGGAMRICGASRETRAMIEGLGYGNLFRFDDSLATSLKALSVKIVDGFRWMATNASPPQPANRDWFMSA